MKSLFKWIVSTLLLLTQPGSAEGTDINKFADLDNGAKISEKSTVNYLFAYFELGPKDSSYSLRKSIVAYHLQKLGAPPYETAAVRRTYGKKTPLEEYDSRPAYEKIPLITEPIFRVDRMVEYPDKRQETQTLKSPVRNKLVTEEEMTKDKGTAVPNTDVSTSAGPFRLRRSTASIRDGFEDIVTSGPDPAIHNAKGATISFSDNRLEDSSGAWNSEGAIYLPIILTANTRGTSTHIGVLPSVSWNLQEIQEAGKENIDELNFALPLYYDYGGGKTGSFFNAVLEPYYQTDTHFDGEIWGSTLAISYIGEIPFLNDPFAPPSELGQGARTKFKLNRWSGIGNSSGYKVRLSGLVDYSETHQTSPYSPRQEGDDWFRVGLDTGIDIGLFRKDEDGAAFEKAPLVLGVSYKFLDTLSGDGGYSDLFSANLTWWMSDYTGLTLEYQKGDTPVANELIDLITLGLEFRY